MKKMIVCNQKMYLVGADAENLNKELLKLDLSDIDLIICPNYLDYNVFNSFNLCAQDAFYEEGPYTSEVSASALSKKGFKYSLVGHSYKRQYDSYEVINKKVIAILNNNMIPIICVGENIEEYNNGLSLKVIKNQLESALKNVSRNSYIIIAYEPVWLVNSGNNMNYEELKIAINNIRNMITDLGFINYKLLYGGSVMYKTIEDTSDINIDGYLIGKAAKNILDIEKIVKCTQKCKQ